MTDFMMMFINAEETYANVFIGIMRYLAPIMAFVLLFRCIRPLMTLPGKRQKTSFDPLGKCNRQK